MIQAADETSLVTVTTVEGGEAGIPKTATPFHHKVRLTLYFGGWVAFWV